MPTGKKIEKQNEERAKIEKLELQYSIDVYDVARKINEIIEVLNTKGETK